MKLLFHNKSDVLNADQLLRIWIDKESGDNGRYILHADLAFPGSCGVPYCVYLGTYSSEENAQKALYLLLDHWKYSDIAYLIPDENLNNSLITEDLKRFW